MPRPAGLTTALLSAAYRPLIWIRDRSGVVGDRSRNRVGGSERGNPCAIAAGDHLDLRSRTRSDGVDDGVGNEPGSEDRPAQHRVIFVSPRTHRGRGDRDDNGEAPTMSNGHCGNTYCFLVGGVVG